MRDIIDHYGDGFINLIGGLVVFITFTACIKNGGVISNAVIAFMQGICG